MPDLPPDLELLKGLQVAVAVTFLVRVVIYSRDVAAAVRHEPKNRNTQFLVSVFGEWVCNTLLFIPLVVLYLEGQSAPLAIPNFPTWWRIAYHVGYLTFGAFLFAIKHKRGEPLWRRFWVWSFAMAGVVLLVIASPWP